MVSLQYTEPNLRHFCAGSIIAEQWILTAAHCLENIIENNPGVIAIVALNRQDRKTEARFYRLTKFLIHKNYDKNTLENDIGLVQTETKIRFERFKNSVYFRINSICLPNSYHKNESAIVAGWGSTTYHSLIDHHRDDITNQMMKAQLKPMDHQKCSELYRTKGSFMLSNGTLCYGSLHHDSCYGDSGGPLFQVINNRFFQIGIVSFGLFCGKEFPGVYTDVFYFKDWILSNTQ